MKKAICLILAMVLMCAQAALADGTRHVLIVQEDENGGADAALVLCIDKAHGRTEILRVSVSEIVTIQGGEEASLSDLWKHGGYQATAPAIDKLYGIELEGYIAVDLPFIIDALNTVDGLDIDVSEERVPLVNAYIERYNAALGYPEGDGLLTKGGLQRLDGKQVMAFARFDGGESAQERNARQQAFTNGLFEKIRTASFGQMLSIAHLVLARTKTEYSLFGMIGLAGDLMGTSGIL